MTKKTTKETPVNTANENVVEGLEFEVLEDVTLPLFKQADNVPMFIRITAPVFLGKKLKGDQSDMEAAELFKVINLENGEVGEIIANAVLKTSIEEHYPDHTYVDKCFRIVRSKVEGKRYKQYKVQEIKLKG